MTDAAERFGREEANARRGVAEHRDQRGCRRAIAEVTEQLRGLGADLRVVVLQEWCERRCLPRILPRELRDPPHAVDARELVLGLTRRCKQLRRCAAVRELELRLLTHTPVGMAKQG